MLNPSLFQEWLMMAAVLKNGLVSWQTPIILEEKIDQNPLVAATSPKGVVWPCLSAEFGCYCFFWEISSYYKCKAISCILK